MLAYFWCIFERFYESQLIPKKTNSLLSGVFERLFERELYIYASAPSNACVYFSFFERFFEIQQIKGFLKDIILLPLFVSSLKHVHIFPFLKGFLKFSRLKAFPQRANVFLHF